MFAARTAWNLTPNALSERLAAHRRAGRAVLDLTESNPTRCGFLYDPETILGALARPQSLVYEPHPKGLPSARRAVADYYAAQGVPVDPEHLILTASTSEGYSFLFRLLVEPGQNVLVPRPSYPLFDFLAQINDVRLRSYPLVYEHGWRVDAEALRAQVDAGTRAILIVNPNNPTGSFLDRDDLSALVDISRQHGLALVADEVFSDYAWAPHPRRVESLAAVHDVLTFTLNGLSKMLGLPQMKLGWICTSGPPAERRTALERLEVIADTYLSVNTPVQVAVPEWLPARAGIQRQILRRVRDNRDFLVEAVNRARLCRCLETEGGWYTVLRVPRTQTEEAWVLQLLDRDSVLVHPGYFFDFVTEGYLVVSLLPPPDVFQSAVMRLLARVEDSTTSQ